MNVAVLGANERARAIARWCALSGVDVRLHTTEVTTVMDSVDIVEQQLDESERGGDRQYIEGTTSLEAAVADADVIIDTTCSDVGELQTRLSEVEALIGEERLVATAVPEVSVTAAAAGLRHPERAVGFRFQSLDESFVEVVLGEGTDSSALAQATEFVERVELEWVPVRDVPGGASTRLSLALETTAIRLLDEGVAGVVAIDTVFKQRYGAAIGPLERIDRVGLDTHLDSLRSLSESFGPQFEPPPLLSTLVDAGQTGAAAGEGFYRWEEGEPAESALADPTIPAAEDENR